MIPYLSKKKKKPNPVWSTGLIWFSWSARPDKKWPKPPEGPANQLRLLFFSEAY